MVKNSGGNKTKKQKRNVKKTIYYDELDEGQLFGQIIKALGNLHFKVICSDGIERNGRASNRVATARDKKVIAGDYVIISKRNFETEDTLNCDILGFAVPPDEIVKIFKRLNKLNETKFDDDIDFTNTEEIKKEIENNDIDVSKI
jgi:initiation factor 1A